MDAQPPPSFTVAARGELAVWELGAGPAVLCLHGFPDHAVGLLPLAEAIAAAGFRAVVPALPGYWPSAPVPDGDYSSEAVCADLLSLLDALGLARAAVVGHDWGAWFGYHLGSRHASRISALAALSSPHPAGYELHGMVLGELRRAAYAWALGYSTRGAELAADPRWLTALAQSWSPGLYRRDWPAILDLLARPTVGEAVAGYYRADLDGAGAPTGRVEVPTTVVYGGQDGCMSPNLYERIEDAFGGPCERRLLPAVGHWPHLEEPELVTWIVLEALRRA